jgi:glycine cleavage system aminomethyltransferase T
MLNNQISNEKLNVQVDLEGPIAEQFLQYMKRNHIRKKSIAASMLIANAIDRDEQIVALMAQERIGKITEPTTV